MKVNCHRVTGLYLYQHIFIPSDKSFSSLITPNETLILGWQKSIRSDYLNLSNVKKSSVVAKFCLNLKFRQSDMSVFKFGSGLSLGIQVWVVRILESFRIWTNLDNQTIGFGLRTIKFICNFGLNSLKILSKQLQRTGFGH